MESCTTIQVIMSNTTSYILSVILNASCIFVVYVTLFEKTLALLEMKVNHFVSQKGICIPDVGVLLVLTYHLHNSKLDVKSICIPDVGVLLVLTYHLHNSKLDVESTTVMDRLGSFVS
ncbi:hypothetical protein K501DRAFT_304166 [Backusella circina FSU 941]|nr:hypothetical protein K501DRAFT_304166 [Backusella circina FSU 941]